jgi:hypothetical protein
MASQPPPTPPTADEKLQRAGTQSGPSKWGRMGNPPASNPYGDAAYTNIGSHEKAALNPRKVAIHAAGEKGIKPPGGPRGMNAPLPSKPKGKR